VHGVEHEAKVVAGEQDAEGVKVKEPAEQFRVRVDCVDHFDDAAALEDRGALSDGFEGDVSLACRGAVLADHTREAEDLLGSFVGDGRAVGPVHLDAKIPERPSFVVRRCEQDRAEAAARAHEVRRARSREQAVLGHDAALHAVRRSEPQHSLDGHVAEIAPISTNDKI
jgi:hypothetical protein